MQNRLSRFFRRLELTIVILAALMPGAVHSDNSRFSTIRLDPFPQEILLTATVGDADNDGSNELVVSTWPSRILAICDVASDGAMTCPHQLQLPAVGSGWWYVSPRVTDVDGDGDNDILAWARANNAKGRLAVARYAMGDWSIDTYPTPESDAGYYMDIGDANGDGLPEVFTTDYGWSTSTALYVIWNEILSPFESALRIPLPGLLAVHPRAMDFDQDGDLDVAVVSHAWGTHPVGLLTNDLGGFSAAYLNPGDGSQSLGLGFGDIDGDGRGDLVASATRPHAYYSHAFAYLGSQSGFGSAIRMETGSGPQGLVIADFDADGYGDVVVDDTHDRTLSVFPGSPSQPATREVIASPDLAALDHGDGTHSDTLTVGDVDNDGDPDVVFSWTGIVFLRNGPLNQPPVAVAGPDQTREAGDACRVDLQLDGTESYDADGDELEFLWQSSAGSFVGATPVVSLTPGSYSFSLTVTDPAQASGSDEVLVFVLDATAPEILAASASPSQLWPPNHRMVSVSLSMNAVDACDGPATCAISSVSSNEPIEGTGDGDASPDWRILDSDSLLLRSERAGNGTGRTYSIAVNCSDERGNQTTQEVQVLVPHSRGK